MREHTVLMYQLITVCHLTIIACVSSLDHGNYIQLVCVCVCKMSFYSLMTICYSQLLKCCKLQQANRCILCGFVCVHDCVYVSKSLVCSIVY